MLILAMLAGRVVVAMLAALEVDGCAKSEYGLGSVDGVKAAADGEKENWEPSIWAVAGKLSAGDSLRPKVGP